MTDARWLSSRNPSTRPLLEGRCPTPRSHDSAPTDARLDLVRLAHSPFIIAGDPPRTLHSQMTIYTTGGGAVVFATGSMQWHWGLDGCNAPWFHPLRVNAAAQQVTHNVLRRMLTGANRN